MSFDTTDLDEACLSDDFSDDAVWFVSGEKPVDLKVIFNIENEYENQDEFSVKVEKITAGTTEPSSKGMRRNHILEIKGRRYKVLGFEPDGQGWIDILLEKTA